MVASASAADPAFYECKKLTKVEGKKYKGKYLDKKCTQSGQQRRRRTGKKNKYELQEGYKGKKNKPFKGKGGKATLHTPAVGGVVDVQIVQGLRLVNRRKTRVKWSRNSRGANPRQNVRERRRENRHDRHEQTRRANWATSTKPKKKSASTLKAETGEILAEFNCEGLEIKSKAP